VNSGRARSFRGRLQGNAVEQINVFGLASGSGVQGGNNGVPLGFAL
jgi:hypothetical protein